MVPKATSLPPALNFLKASNSLSEGCSRYTLEACAKPSKRGICPAVGEMSEELFFCAMRSFHWPLLSKLRVA